jgi:hypothetical protein
VKQADWPREAGGKEQEKQGDRLGEQTDWCKGSRRIGLGGEGGIGRGRQSYFKM